MIGSTRALRVWAHAAPTDMRKSYNGLYHIVEESLKRDPLSGDIYLFTNRRRNRAKCLHWDGTGLAIYMKRLEEGRFACLWRLGEGGVLELTQSELALFLEGGELLGKFPLSPQKFVPRPLHIQKE